jgi:hypothetical protein
MAATCVALLLIAVVGASTSTGVGSSGAVAVLDGRVVYCWIGDRLSVMLWDAVQRGWGWQVALTVSEPKESRREFMSEAGTHQVSDIARKDESKEL